MGLQQDQIQQQERLVEKQGEQQAKNQMRGAAIQQGQQASQSPAMMGGQPSKEFIEVIGSPDISDPEDADDDLERLVATETSRLEMFANITEEEYVAKKLLNQNIAEGIKHQEFVPQKGMGSKCKGAYRSIVTGDPDEGNRKALSPDMARRVDGAVGEESVRSQMQSGSIRAKFFEGLTQMQTAVFAGDKGTAAANGASSGGLVGGAKRLLFGK
jgi:hypothetical protein